MQATTMAISEGDGQGNGRRVVEEVEGAVGEREIRKKLRRDCGVVVTSIDEGRRGWAIAENERRDDTVFADERPTSERELCEGWHEGRSSYCVEVRILFRTLIFQILLLIL